MRTAIADIALATPGPRVRDLIIQPPPPVLPLRHRGDAPEYCGLTFYKGKAGLYLSADQYHGYSSPEPPKPPAGTSAMWENPTEVTGELVGYRAWDYKVRVGPDWKVEARLQSPYHDNLWDGPVQHADETPEEGTDHGLYAVGTSKFHADNWWTYLREEPIWGRVGMSGIVVEGGSGFRAQTMTIQELWLNPNAEIEDDPISLMSLLADRYQCEVSFRAPDREGL